MACSSSSVFTSGLLAFPYVCCLLAGSLRHVHASRVPGLLRGLRPIPCLQRTVRLSRPRGWSPRGGTSTRWFPCSLRIDRPGRHPALPRQHRHGYAAGLHRDLPAGTPSQLRSQPPPQGWPRTASRPVSARFEPVPRLRGFITGSCSYAFWSRSPDTAQKLPVWPVRARECSLAADVSAGARCRCRQTTRRQRERRGQDDT